MSISNPRLSNHLQAPLTAGFVGSMRQAFGKVAVTYVNEGTVSLGKKTEVTEQELVNYSRPRTVKGKTVYERVAFTVGRIAE